MIIKNRNFLFTSESVSEGHPDKVSDQISDAILDAYLAGDKNSRVACETLVTTGLVVVAGEVTSKTIVDIQSVARKTVEEIGYTDSATGFDFKSCAVLTSLHSQSSDIAMGVDVSASREQGAGDQGMMFGYACDETPELMPLPIVLAHRLVGRLAEMRKAGIIKSLRPDSKSQVTIEYRDGVPARIDSVVLSTQHDPFTADFTNATLAAEIKAKLFSEVLPANMVDDATTYYINPTGQFEIGGPHGDTGLTGRKIIVDTYGGFGAHGGGAFSGKDPSKVDRSAAYMARYIAKNIVAAKLAGRCLIQLAYAIGVAEPVSVFVDTYGTGSVPDDLITAAVRKVFRLKPAEIIETLDLLRPIYRKTAAYGHFGRQEFPWERVDQVDALLSNTR